MTYEAEEMVMAWGENGLEPTPASQVVMIEALPVGEGNLVIPATLRSLGRGCADGRYVPIRLLAIEMPTKRNGRSYVRVCFATQRHLKWTTPSGEPVYGERSEVAVRNKGDAFDALFAGLTPRERVRIQNAGMRWDAMRARAMP